MTLRARVRDLVARLAVSGGGGWLLFVVLAVAVGLLVVLAAHCGKPAREETRRVEQLDEQRVAALVQQLRSQAATVEHLEVRETTRPDGTKERLTTRNRRTETASTATTKATERLELRQVVEEQRIVERRPRLRAELRLRPGGDGLADALRSVPRVEGATASVRLAGPLWLGAWVQRDELRGWRRPVPGVAISVEW